VSNVILGYNTNGFAHHRFEDAVEILAGIGYRSVAITLDHFVLNPFDSDLRRQCVQARRLLARRRMGSVIETGARFLLDPSRKHHPTLMSRALSDRVRRGKFLRRAIDAAAGLKSQAVSFWSGALQDDVTHAVAMRRLVDGCLAAVEYAAQRGVRLAFEPEPGMYVSRMEQFDELLDRVDHPLFGLTLDIGHLHCLDDGPIPDVIGRWKDRLFNIHIEDMRRGVHDHLMFGEGEINFGPVLAKLQAIGYAGGVHVELSRHSHDAVAVARRAFEFLNQAAKGASCRFER